VSASVADSWGPLLCNVEEKKVGIEQVESGGALDFIGGIANRSFLDLVAADEFSLIFDKIEATSRSSGTDVVLFRGRSVKCIQTSFDKPLTGVSALIDTVWNANGGIARIENPVEVHSLIKARELNISDLIKVFPYDLNQAFFVDGNVDLIKKKISLRGYNVSGVRLRESLTAGKR
jgi:hypothetical protein